MNDIIDIEVEIAHRTGPDEHGPNYESCYFCNGTGQAFDGGGDPGICRHCLGDGVIPVELEEPDGDEIEGVAI